MIECGEVIVHKLYLTGDNAFAEFIQLVNKGTAQVFSFILQNLLCRAITTCQCLRLDKNYSTPSRSKPALHMQYFVELVRSA